MISRVDEITPVLVFVGMGFGFSHQFIDLLLGKAAGGRDLDALLFPRPEIFCRDMDDAVRVDVKGDLDLRQPPRCGRDAHQFKATECLVIRRHGPLALDDMDAHGRLVIRCRGEDLALSRGDGGVLLNQLGQNASQRLDPKRKRRDIQQQDILHLAAENSRLNGCPDGHHLVGIHSPVRFLPEDISDFLLDPRHAGHAAHENHLVDLLGREIGVLQGRPAGAFQLDDEFFHEGLEFRARELHGQVLGTRGVSGDEGKVDIRLHGG